MNNYSVKSYLTAIFIKWIWMSGNHASDDAQDVYAALVGDWTVNSPALFATLMILALNWEQARGIDGGRLFCLMHQCKPVIASAEFQVVRGLF